MCVGLAKLAQFFAAPCRSLLKNLSPFRLARRNRTATSHLLVRKGSLVATPPVSASQHTSFHCRSMELMLF